MLDSTYFVPGTILWLPRPKHIDNFDENEPYNTVPRTCHDHPLLVLNDGKGMDYVSVLIVRNLRAMSHFIIVFELPETMLIAYAYTYV